MLTRSARSRGFGGRVGDAILGSWTRTVAVVAVALVIFGIIGFLAATGRLGDLRYANIPLVHPYPPAGFYQNSFNPTDRGDLINTATAAKVKSDLEADGQIERWAVDGTPTDAVYIGLNHVLKDRRPDVVAAGVNRGPNLANDVHYSGTVAAARIDPRPRVRENPSTGG